MDLLIFTSSISDTRELMIAREDILLTVSIVNFHLGGANDGRQLRRLPVDQSAR